jgi:ABC transporter DrrB family efflux protein
VTASTTTIEPTIAPAIDSIRPDAEPHPARGVLHDSWVIARRGIIHMKRQPEQLSDATLQPIMFVVLFAYVFGGAISVPGGSGAASAQRYREFLMGGIIAQTIVFGAFGVAFGIANDRKSQAIDRFRSMPIARSAILGGQALAYLAKALLPIILMSITGFIIGWRIRGTLFETIMAYVLMMGFAFAMIWIGILLGSIVRSPEGVTGLAFAVLFPLTFVASTFVPLNSMPDALQGFAAWNPVTTLSDALRELFGNPNTPTKPSDPWPIAHPVAYTWIWVIGIIVVCAPLAVRAFKRSTGD